jgi:hypothetical protein
VLLFEHDWFAVAAMMKMCQPEQEEPRWREAQKRLQEPGVTCEVVDEVIQLLDKCSSLSIVLLDEKASRAALAPEAQRRSDLVVLAGSFRSCVLPFPSSVSSLQQAAEADMVTLLPG